MLALRSGLVVALGLFKVAGDAANVGEVVVRDAVAGVEAESLFVDLGSLFDPALLDEDSAEVDIGFDVARLETNGLAQ